MRLLITGICGFAGSNLAEAMVDHCDLGSLEIGGVDNFSRAGTWLNHDRLAARGVKVVHGDIRSASDLESIGSFHWVIYATTVHVDNEFRFPNGLPAKDTKRVS